MMAVSELLDSGKRSRRLKCTQTHNGSRKDERIFTGGNDREQSNKSATGWQSNKFRRARLGRRSGTNNRSKHWNKEQVAGHKGYQQQNNINNLARS